MTKFQYRVQYGRYVNGVHESDQLVVNNFDDLFVETYYHNSVEVSPEVIVKVDDQSYKVEDGKYFPIKYGKPSANTFIEMALKKYSRGKLVNN